MPSLVSPETRPPEFCDATTRSGLYLAIASRLGVSPLSVVFLAVTGKSESWSTATTWGPAPTAYRSSVAVAASETIRAGLALIVTFPLDAVTVTGNEAPALLFRAVLDAVLADVLADVAQLVRAAEAATAVTVASAILGSNGFLPRYRAGRRDRWRAPGADRDGSPFPRGSMSSSAAGGDLAWARTGRHSCGTAPEWPCVLERGFTGFATWSAARHNSTHA